MKYLILLVLLLPLVLPAQTILVKNAAIVDVRDGHLIRNTDILIEKNKIAVIGKNLKAGTPDVQIIDGSGKYLIPGLWDMHGHFLKRWDRFAPLYVANGVTGVRDMATALPLDQVRVIRQNALDGKITGPRFITAGPLLDGPQSRFPQAALLIGSKEQAMKVADSLRLAGVDFYKVYETLPREAFYAIMERAKEYHMTVTGHVPAAIRLEEAVIAGMKSVEHMRSVAPSTPLPDSLKGIFRAAMWDLANKDTAAAIRKNVWGTQVAMKYFKQEDAISKGKLLADHHTWATPTMVQSLRGYFSKEELLQNPNWEYMPASITAGWRYRVANDIKLMRFDIPEYVELELKTVQGLYKGGVKFLAGTDANDAFIGNIPGFSVHQEMQLFVRVGLSNLEALQTATLNPALFLEATDSLGTIEENKIADIVLLDANPLENIAHTEKIHGVILNGRYYDRKKLDALLEGVKELVRDQ